MLSEPLNRALNWQLLFNLFLLRNSKAQHVLYKSVLGFFVLWIKVEGVIKGEVLYLMKDN